MPKRRHLLLSLLPTLWPGGPALSAATRGALRAYAHPMPPLSHELDGQPTGLAVDLLRMMAESAGLALSLDMQPRLRAEKSFLAAAPASLLFPIAHLPDRENQYRWVGPIVPRRIAVFCLSTRMDIQYQGLQQLKGLRVGVPAGTATLKQLMEAGLKPGQDIEVSPSYASNVRKLLSGRMDLLVMSDISAYWQLRLLGEPAGRIKVIGEMPGGADYAYALRADSDPALAAALQRALDQLRQSGQIERLRLQYGMVDTIAPAPAASHRHS